MSQSLNRIRSLVTEIEQIQKIGQRTPRSPAPVEGPEVGVEPLKHAPVESISRESIPREPIPQEPSRVSLQWSGSVVLDLRFPHSNETLQLRQVGDLMEIRFSDGKAVHIPFKAVA